MTAVLFSKPRADLEADPLDDAALLRRFVAGDELAFQTLVHRHGPMVLGICRRVLGNAHDAEDAFQVTFLLLARKAASLSRPELLAGWLYGVAHRTARKLRTSNTRRQANEVPVDDPDWTPSPVPTPPLDLAWREVQEALDEEIARLDIKYRAPLVLCYIEGKTHEEVARRLGRPLGSMSWLLARALAELRSRLARRGMTLLGAMPGLLLALNPSVQPDDRLVQTTLRAILAVEISSPVARLLEMLVHERPVRQVSRFVTALTLSLVVGLVLGLIGLQSLFGRSPDPNPGGGGCCSRGDPPAAPR